MISPADLPQQAPRRNRFDMTKTYEFDSRDYWKKRATRRQQLIENRDADIKALETRLIELETELATLREGTK